MTYRKILSSQRGSLFFETLLVVILLAIVVITISPIITFQLRKTRTTRHDTQASLYLQESTEVLYHLLLANWDNYTYGTYEISTTSTGDPNKPERWELVSLAPGQSEKLEELYDRTTQILGVCRDVTQKGEMVATSDTGSCTVGTLDDQSKMIQVSIVWSDEGIPKGPITTNLLVNKYIQIL